VQILDALTQLLYLTSISIKNTEYVHSRLHLTLFILNVEQQFKNYCKGRIKHCSHIIKLCANQLFYT
jgi:hypothetical protein